MKQIAIGLALTYTMLVVAWFVAYKLVGDDHWLLAMVNAFAVYLFLPLPLVGLVALWIRHPLAWTVLLALTLLFLGLFGADLMPPLGRASSESGGLVLTIATYNVLFKTTDSGPIAANIRRIGADIVAIQELTPQKKAQLAQELGSLYPHRTPIHDDCRFDVAIWSRYPLQVEEVDDDDERCHVRPVVVDFNGQAVRVIDVHAWPLMGLDPETLARGFRWRREQVELVFDLVEGKPEPLIVLGDLNSTPTHEAYHLLSTRLTDAFREAGWGLGHTYPATGEHLWGVPCLARLARLDHIFFSDHWHAEAAWVGEWDGVSDHLPVIAQLKLNRTD